MKVRLIVLGFFVAVLFSCSKNDGSPARPDQNFTYNVRGTEHTADSSSAFISRYNKPTILAWDKENATGTYKIAFGVTSFQIGTYSFAPSVAGSNPPPLTNNLNYFDENGDQLEVLNGGVNILANADFRISGDFTANLRDAQGLPVHLSGSFTDIPINP